MSSLRTHGNTSFFKYYSASSAKLTLSSGKRKWSSPSIFNDPFDNQFELQVQEYSEDLVDTALQTFLKLVRADPSVDSTTPWNELSILERLRRVYQQNPSFTHSNKDLEYLRA